MIFAQLPLLPDFQSEMDDKKLEKNRELVDVSTLPSSDPHVHAHSANEVNEDIIPKGSMQSPP